MGKFYTTNPRVSVLRGYQVVMWVVVFCGREQCQFGKVAENPKHVLKESEMSGNKIVYGDGWDDVKDCLGFTGNYVINYN